LYFYDIHIESRTRSRTLSPSLRGDGEDYYGDGGMSKGGTSGSEPDI